MVGEGEEGKSKEKKEKSKPTAKEDVDDDRSDSDPADGEDEGSESEDEVEQDEDEDEDMDQKKTVKADGGNANSERTCPPLQLPLTLHQFATSKLILSVYNKARWSAEEKAKVAAFRWESSCF